MLRKYDELLLRQFRRLAGRIHQLTGFTNVGISNWILYTGLSTCFFESILDFKFRTIDFETYFHFLYVLVIAIGIIPMLHSQQRIAESNPSAPNKLASCMAFFRRAAAVLFPLSVLRLFVSFHFNVPLCPIPYMADRTAMEQSVLNQTEITLTFLFFYFASIEPGDPEKSLNAAH